MSDIAKLDQELNEKIFTGKAVKGFEVYDADDVVMQENNDGPFLKKSESHPRVGILPASRGMAWRESGA